MLVCPCCTAHKCAAQVWPRAEHGVQRERKHAFLASRGTAATTHCELMQAKPDQILPTLTHVRTSTRDQSHAVVRDTVASSIFLINGSILRRKTNNRMHICKKLLFSYLRCSRRNYCWRSTHCTLSSVVLPACQFAASRPIPSFLPHLWGTSGARLHLTCHSSLFVGALRHAGHPIALEFHHA